MIFYSLYYATVCVVILLVLVEKGNTVVAVGTPEKVALVQKSYTGQFLKGMLGKE